jgi:hypothetical protein
MTILSMNWCYLIFKIDSSRLNVNWMHISDPLQILINTLHYSKNFQQVDCSVTFIQLPYLKKRVSWLMRSVYCRSWPSSNLFQLPSRFTNFHVSQYGHHAIRGCYNIMILNYYTSKYKFFQNKKCNHINNNSV